MQARFAAARGETAIAATSVSQMLASSGPQSAAALATLVDLNLADAQPLDPAQVTALQFHLAEAAGTAEAAGLARALVLAHALAGDFDAAFAALPDAPAARADLWHLLAKGPDSAVLLHAIGADPDGLSPDTRRAMADRMLALGFPAEAQLWSGNSAPLVMPAPGLDAQQTGIMARDWAAIAANGSPIWQSAAQTLSPAEPEGGPLTRGRALAETSAQTRAALDALLSEVPPPAASGPVVP
jgi:hypothetical protein